MIRSFFERRRVKKVFGRLVRPEIVEAILRGDGIERQTFAAGRIEFVLVFVAGKTPEEISERVSRVSDVAISHDGIVHDIVGALIVVAFGTHLASSPTAGKRAALVEQLQRDFSSGVKIVHGAADGHFGLVGNEKRIAFTFILPRFDTILGRLSRLEFGQIEEFES